MISTSGELFTKPAPQSPGLNYWGNDPILASAASVFQRGAWLFKLLRLWELLLCPTEARGRYGPTVGGKEDGGQKAEQTSFMHSMPSCAPCPGAPSTPGSSGPLPGSQHSPSPSFLTALCWLMGARTPSPSCQDHPSAHMYRSIAPVGCGTAHLNSTLQLSQSLPLPLSPACPLWLLPHLPCQLCP